MYFSVPQMDFLCAWKSHCRSEIWLPRGWSLLEFIRTSAVSYVVSFDVKNRTSVCLFLWRKEVHTDWRFTGMQCTESSLWVPITLELFRALYFFYTHSSQEKIGVLPFCLSSHSHLSSFGCFMFPFPLRLPFASGYDWWYYYMCNTLWIINLALWAKIK